MIPAMTDDKFLDWLYDRVSQRTALDPATPEQLALYEPLYEDDPDDQVELMRQCIKRSKVDSFQCFSGFRGSGKTTELFRLRKLLKDDDCLVFYADALDYLSPADAIDIGDMLLVIAGAFNDQLIEQDLGNGLKESWWARASHYLKTTEVEVPEIEVGGDIAGVGVKLKAALKTSPTFRQQVSKALVHRLKELKNHVDEFFAENLQRIRKETGTDTKIIFIFDQLEQIQGTRANEADVVDSITRLFSNSREMLTIPHIHLVYTVPPWLKFVLRNFQARILPTIKLWKKKDRARVSEGYQTLISVLKLRFTEEGFERFFGKLTPKGSHALAEKLIEHSGGHFRDLLRLLEETILRTRKPPVTRDIVDRAIATVRRSFEGISREDAVVLQKIADQRACIPETNSPQEITRLATFLNTHVVLYFINGDEWYDLHPLIRGEVAEIMRQEQDAKI